LSNATEMLNTQSNQRASDNCMWTDNGTNSN